MTLDFRTDSEFMPDLEDIIRIFFHDYERGGGARDLLEFRIQEGIYKVLLNAEPIYSCPSGIMGNNIIGTMENKRMSKRSQKHALYLALKGLCKRSIPWGSLTGVRPTRLAYEIASRGEDDAAIAKTLIESFDLDPKKAQLLVDILYMQRGITENGAVDLYVNIPVCPSRCYYCSFISADYRSAKKHLTRYVDLLCSEIAEAYSLIGGRSFRAVYIGGGTPTVLPDELLDRVLSCIRPADEFTVEAGRPDCINNGNLALLKRHGVTRISVNPQTFSDATLALIGRMHTVGDILAAYKLARSFEFDINMDLIAGLRGEGAADFFRSVDCASALRPDNITIHTLAVKGGSQLKNDGIEHCKDITEMLEYAHRALHTDGYKPYYLYRLKNMLGNYENTGYALPGKACKFNIDTMEECADIIACGAGGISKRLFGEGRIERTANVKQLGEYIERFEEMTQRKRLLFL